MRITIEINCDNDAFQDGPELARILKELGKIAKMVLSSTNYLYAI